MYSDFKAKGIEYVRQAVDEDTNGNYEKAFQLYMHALEYFQTHLKYEKNPKAKDAITKKFTEYLERAEQVRAIVDQQKSGAAPVAEAPAGAGAGKPGTAKDKAKDAEDAETAKLRGNLDSAILSEKPNIKWDDVAGLEGAKEALKEAVILPVKFPQFFTGNRKAWKALLLYGPPGTGKSYLAKAVATEADSTFFSVSSSTLVSKWMGESEKMVSNLFAMARENNPAIIFIDELDSLCSARGDSESEAARRIKTEFLVQMQGVGNSNDNVLVLGATNMPYMLDQAVRRRFDKRIYIPLPEVNARAHMFKVHLGDTPHDLSQDDLYELGSRTEGFSGSDVAVVVKDVLFQPVRRVQEATHFKAIQDAEGKTIYEPCSPGDPGAFEATLEQFATNGCSEQVMPPKICKGDFERVLTRARPTVSVKDLEDHTRFTEEFGEEG
mmetsp:Transcript_42512/g.51618  ORF Transcript_42512/g.51618 Transcript_42512/m.51618 type:complete len:438 (-) Transcript_42512:464-1777(-)|eukprot:CAMPEP_0197858648 /NCGR_PEP_ID=MMETSP1438-20131217/32564_1 /TAXON_ID=1461541 /ORGANISM="Pterosperma sp., Strain CCMP1384" /LENGTH=437 /DNA_ID=CAMNT_0043474873 /DNA_START=170 /DNA_END=1483 /DNA_ORIENTATION=+